jgi:hypothetical protein
VARSAGSGRSSARPREPVKPERDVSTFHPVATERAPLGARRTRLVLGALALAAAIGVGLYVWLLDSEPRSGTGATATSARPADPAPNQPTPAPSPPPLPIAVVAKPDAGHADAPNTGWVQPALAPKLDTAAAAQTDSSATDTGRARHSTTRTPDAPRRSRRSAKTPAVVQPPGTPASSPLDTILGDSTNKVDSILEAKPQPR